MAKVFISYRREDSKWQAREVYRALTHVLARDHVFMDVDSIRPGDDFVDVLEGWVDQCDILLALIGNGWIDAVDPKTHRRRLENPEDFVRIEVRKALTRGIPVVPVLLDGAPIPEVDRLPDDLKRLTRRNAEFIEHRTVDTDVERLIRRLGLSKEGPRPAQPQTASPSTAKRNSTEGRIKVDAKIIHGAPDGWFKPGNGETEWFKDYDAGPEMVVVPAGRFMMGSPETEPGRFDDEGPQREVTIAQPFAVGRHAVAQAQFAAFVSDTGYRTDGGAAVWRLDVHKLDDDPNASWRSPGFHQDGSHPVVCVSLDDATAYVAWLSQKTGRIYRVLSSAEWEYVARASTTTPFWWGSSITPAQANYDGRHVYPDGYYSGGEHRNRTVPVGSFVGNPWGLFNVHGNVWEQCEGVAKVAKYRVVVRGGSWYNDPRRLRSACRQGGAADFRSNDHGFRVARTLNL
jgi:formylglycine-generating enzyme required for sulfatase activity